MKPTSWYHQDVLKLTEEQWLDALKNPRIFDENALKIVEYVFHQPGYASTASDIGKYFHVHCNQVTAWNRKAAKALYLKYHTEPPIDKRGERRYWNLVFDGNPEHVQNKEKHFYWILRPNLVKALQAFHLK